MNKKQLITIITLCAVLIFLLVGFYDKFKSRPTNKEAKYFADIIYASAYETVYNSDYLKKVFEKNNIVNKDVIFLNYLAYLTRYFDYHCNLFLEKKYRTCLVSLVIDDISNHLQKVSKNDSMATYFISLFNKRANDFVRYSHSEFSEEKMKIIFNEEKIPQFINMDGEPDFEFTKDIIKLLNESMESFLASEVYNTITAIEDGISKQIGNNLKAYFKKISKSTTFSKRGK